MIGKASQRLRAMVLVSALAGVMTGVLGGLFVSYAQIDFNYGEDYYCPDGSYETCEDWSPFDEWKPYGGTGGETGGGGTWGTGGTGGGGCGGTWTCPATSFTINGPNNTTTKCTSTGCRKASLHPDAAWVCAFTQEGSEKCPPLMTCECE